MIDVSVLVGAQVREPGTGRTGRVTQISLPWVKVQWNQDPIYRAVEETYARSDLRIWTDFELFTLNGGWVSMGSILGARPRGRIKQFTEDIENLLADAGEPVEETASIPNADEQKDAWKLLKVALKTAKLPTLSGKARTKVDPDEFMLMHMANNYYFFKHRYSRNYVLIDMVTGKLVVPKEQQAFFRGTFDESVETEVMFREKRSLPFRRHVFASQEEASEFVAQLFEKQYEEIRWRSEGMAEDWEIELTGLFQALAEGCKACEASKLESLSGIDLFKRKAEGPESEADDWDCDEELGCMHGPSGFTIKIDFGD